MSSVVSITDFPQITRTIFKKYKSKEEREKALVELITDSKAQEAIKMWAEKYDFFSKKSPFMGNLLQRKVVFVNKESISTNSYISYPSEIVELENLVMNAPKNVSAYLQSNQDLSTTRMILNYVNLGIFDERYLEEISKKPFYEPIFWKTDFQGRSAFHDLNVSKEVFPFLCKIKFEPELLKDILLIKDNDGKTPLHDNFIFIEALPFLFHLFEKNNDLLQNALTAKNKLGISPLSYLDILTEAMPLLKKISEKDIILLIIIITAGDNEGNTIIHFKTLFKVFFPILESLIPKNTDVVSFLIHYENNKKISPLADVDIHDIISQLSEKLDEQTRQTLLKPPSLEFLKKLDSQIKEKNSKTFVEKNKLPILKREASFSIPKKENPSSPLESDRRVRYSTRSNTLGIIPAAKQ